MSLSKLQQKILTLCMCFITDAALVAWVYFKATNYNRYTKVAGTVVDSPDFQFQVYGILLQTLTFALLLFLIAQFIVYILAWRNFRAAWFYLKYFAVCGFAASMYITITSNSFALAPMIIYIIGYYVFARTFKELTESAQSLPLQSTPQ